MMAEEHPMKIRFFRIVGAAALVTFAVTACSSTDAPSTAGHKPVIVASTNVWGDVAKQIGGTHVEISSIISDPAQDPHSYEADAQVQLSLSRADIVIENGGGYDDFVPKLLAGAGNKDAAVLNAVDISGLDTHPATGSFNEHVWYDFPTVQKVAAKITSTLSKRDPGNAGRYSANEKKFDAALATLEAGEASIRASAAAGSGSGVAITEPVPLYLTTAVGLVNKTPEKFSEAIEEGTDVAPTVLQETLALFSEHVVKLLVYNEQTSGPETQRILAAAKAAGVAIVPVSETVPKGKTYLGWMTANLDNVRAALR